MDTNLLILITLVCFLGCLVYIGYSVFFNRKSTQFDNLMRASRGGKGIALEVRKRINEDETGEEFERLRDSHRKSFEKFGKQQISEEERMFHAGLFSQGQQQAFKNFRKFGPTALAAGVAILLFTMMGQAIFMVYGALIGMLAGLSVPGFYLDRKIKKRSEEIMFYLPLVIEQLAIGVSSSLDIGPCIQNVVQMADERDSHNVVTELFRHCEYYVKSGVSLEEALSEIGKNLDTLN